MRTALPVRRRLVVLALPLLALATACGSGTSDAADVAPAASQAAAAFPVTLEHAFGSTTVPAQPTKVVSVGFTDQDPLLAVGVTPVGVREWFGAQPYATWPWAQEALGDAKPTVLGASELELEKIAALDPDLIVGLSSGMTQEQYATLSKIAPTLARPKDVVDFGVSWQDATRLVGKAVGRSDRAEQVVDDVEETFAEAREQNPSLAGKTATFGIMFEAGSVSAYGPQDARGRLLADLGLQLPKAVVDGAGDTFFAAVSGERLREIDADALVWGEFGDSDDYVRKLPLRPSLKAVKTGGEFFLTDQESGAASFGTALSLPALLDTFVPKLVAAVDGDPATAVPGSAG